MNNHRYITLLDPSLKNNEGMPSDNLGDVIIYDSIKLILEDLFPGEEVCRISTHICFTKKEKHLINNARFTFAGGSSMLTSDIRHFPRLTPVKNKGFYFFPGFKNVILLGTGWASYQQKLDWASRTYYKNILRRDMLHAVRDNYSLGQLTHAGFSNIIHTSCPTTWNMDTTFRNQFNVASKKILMTLTNYDYNIETDDKLVETIVKTEANEIWFFPQSSLDTDYLDTLPSYRKNKSKFRLLNHNLREFYELISSTQLNYIGNRLHAGIKCLANNQPTMIISIDNRAAEMGNSINLNVAERGNFGLLQQWINNESATSAIRLPLDNIRKWKEQFVMK